MQGQFCLFITSSAFYQTEAGEAAALPVADEGAQRDGADEGRGCRLRHGDHLESCSKRHFRCARTEALEADIGDVAADTEHVAAKGQAVGVVAEVPRIRCRGIPE